MPTYECVIAYVNAPSEESTVIVEAPSQGEALTENFSQRPGTFVKAIREVNSPS
jgi:hypothetical protein